MSQLADTNEAALCNDVTPGNCICAKQHVVSPDYAREVSSLKPYLSSETFFSHQLTVRMYFYIQIVSQLVTMLGIKSVSTRMLLNICH